MTNCKITLIVPKPDQAKLDALHHGMIEIYLDKAMQARHDKEYNNALKCYRLADGLLHKIPVFTDKEIKLHKTIGYGICHCKLNINLH